MQVSTSIAVSLAMAALAIMCGIVHLSGAHETGWEESAAVKASNPPSWCGLECVEIYDDIDNHLVELSRSRSHCGYAELISEITSWLEDQIKSSSETQERKILIERALNQIIALDELGSSDDNVVGLKCDQATYDILSANDQASRRGAHGSVESGAMRIIDQLIRHHLIRHVQVCREAYTDLIETKLLRMDYMKVSQVNTFTNGFIYDNFERRKYPSYNMRAHEVNWSLKTSASLRAKLAKSTKVAEIVDCTSIGSLYRWQNPLDLLLYLSYDDLDRDCLSKGSKCRFKEKQTAMLKLYNKYLVEPCKYYVSELKDLNMITDYNDQMAVGKDYSIDETDYIKRTLDFYIGRAKYEICSVLINQTERKVIRKLVREISKDPLRNDDNVGRLTK